MSAGSIDDDQFEGFAYGDVVEHRMNTDVFGVVIGFEGSLITMRLSPSLAKAQFHDYELRSVEDDNYEEPPAKDVDGSSSVNSNVVDLANWRAERMVS